MNRFYLKKVNKNIFCLLKDFFSIKIKKTTKKQKIKLLKILKIIY